MSTKTDKEKAAPTGIKVSELAKELSKGLPKSQEIKSTSVLDKAKELGIPVKGHSSVLTPGQADRLRAKLGAGKKLKETVDEAKARSGRMKAITPEDLAADMPVVEETAAPAVDTDAMKKEKSQEEEDKE